MMSNRSKRQSQQIQTTVKMKLDLLEKQKQDILDIIDDYASEVVKSAENLLSSHPVSGENIGLYSTVLQKLDKTSELFTNIAIHIDEILDDPRQGELPEREEKKFKTSSKASDLDKICKSLAPDEDEMFSKFNMVNKENFEKQVHSKPLLDLSQFTRKLPKKSKNQEVNPFFGSNLTEKIIEKSNDNTLETQVQDLTGSTSLNISMLEHQNSVPLENITDNHFLRPLGSYPLSTLKDSTTSAHIVPSATSAPLPKSKSQYVNHMPTNNQPLPVQAQLFADNFGRNNNSLNLSDVSQTNHMCNVDQKDASFDRSVNAKSFMFNKGSSASSKSSGQQSGGFLPFLRGRKKKTKLDLEKIIQEVRKETLSNTATQKASCDFKKTTGTSLTPTDYVVIPEALVEKDDILAVVINDVDHPWSFHAQLHRKFDDEIEEKIRKLISSGKHESVVPCKGLFCLAKFKDNKFYRAKILSVQETEDKVKVIYVDYGNSLTISVNDVFVLPKDLAEYPANNIFCALSGVSPKNSEVMWPEEAILSFQQYAIDKQAQIRIVSSHCGKSDSSLPHIVDMILKNKFINSPQNLSATLIQEGLAKTIKLKDMECALVRQYCAHDSIGLPPHGSVTNVNLNSQLNGSGPFIAKDIDSQSHPDKQRCEVVNTSPSPSPKAQPNDLKKNNESERNEDIEDSFVLGNNLLVSLGSSLRKSEDKDLNMTMPIVIPDCEIKVMLCNVVSPSSFFVHCVTEETGKTLDYLQERMILLQSELQHRNEQFTPIKYSLCCAVCSLDGKLYRGLVLENCQELSDTQNHEHGKVLIFFIDYGDFQWVMNSNVFQLPEDLKKIRPMVVWCTLANIEPQLNEESVTKQHLQPAWSSHVVEQFKAMTSTQDVFYAVTTEKVTHKITECGSFQLEPLPIYLLDRSGPQEICLNYELINLGLAAVNTSCQLPINGDSAMSGSNNAENLELEKWDPMSEEYTSLRNSYKVDIDDAGVALTGYSSTSNSKDVRGVCVYFNKSSGCKRGMNCPNLHVKVQDAGATYKIPVLMFDEEQTLPQPGTSNVTVTYVKSPSEFYVNIHGAPVIAQNLQCNVNFVEALLEEESLEGLMANMQEYYKTSIYYDGDLTLLALGQAVVVKIRGIWMRAKVIDTDVEGCQVQVMLVDYGNLEWVNETDIREIQLQFIHLTPQAVQCVLGDFVPKDEFEGWTESACNAFANMVMGKQLVLQVQHRYPTGHIEVTLYDSSRKDIRESLLDYGLFSNSTRHVEMEAVSQQFSDAIKPV